ncbi:hypothetical protein SAY87_000071 [Trapa incisa]|uniref:Mei2-like C-terminal RNA recognition motif domain-containing protein n=1 Tax=Trapa incisa TaxID=236973 RepID=A0AAN7GB57_9MYRT|nr:hypothetical protein SAY87_000071 [Trapa incisa]
MESQYYLPYYIYVQSHHAPMASLKPLNPSAAPFLPVAVFQPAFLLWHPPFRCYTLPHRVGGYSQNPLGKQGPLYGRRMARGFVPPRLMLTPKEETTRWAHSSNGKQRWMPTDFRPPDDCDKDREKPLADVAGDEEEEEQYEDDDHDDKFVAESSGLRQELIEILDEHCRTANINRSKLRSERKGNKGYAFVNFTTTEAALRMWREFNDFVWHGFRWKNLCYQSKKTCKICAAKIQGKRKLESSLRNRVFPNEDYQPVVAAATPRDGMNEAALCVIGNTFMDDSHGG